MLFIIHRYSNGDIHSALNTLKTEQAKITDDSERAFQLEELTNKTMLLFIETVQEKVHNHKIIIDDDDEKTKYR